MARFRPKAFFREQRPMTHRRLLSLCGVAVVLSAAAANGQSTSRPAGASAPAMTAMRGSQTDFDFEFGEWKARVSRLLRPLTGSNEWVTFEGTSVVRKVWDGRANLGELDVQGPGGRITGMTLRLFNPETQQWNISWANARDGALGPPMYGGFTNGRGEFYNQETLNGRAIFVRFVFSDVTPTTFRFEQAFSGDGGKTWEVNWIATFTR
jgi:hypothetical protein